ncbi:hypothetical protein PGT21_017477 [Puccinia graminis f. sp. tritici]|uniref:Superoxide dismutase copper/zinc binding domain-containing protein n=1 Tax=Puccinia graminis f. sp. tritici TaxID=56615 RepID=A0A5B0S1Q2_PUCGR|nr:hypothetical protein PGT21_017477 [Puccinia graminis f. sp. tritici]KAA1131970.1 hypothetical protein PGTUg99_035007 [Puccinia graminis f. sp. tritici]
MIKNSLYWMMLAVSHLSSIAAAGLPIIDPQDCIVRSATASVAGLGVQGTFHFSRKETQKGITTLVNFKVTGLKDGEEFDYSIYNDPINESGNCDSANGRFNPTNSALLGKCLTSHREQCQAGDLSGKYGKLVGSNTGSVTQRYSDSTLKISPSERGIVNKSIVIVNSDMQRIACGTILPDKC